MIRLTICIAAVVLVASASVSGADVPADIHTPVAAGEHPRLIVRGGAAVAELRAQAQTEYGKKVDERLKQALKLMTKATIAGQNRDVLKEAGYRAAGHGAVYLLDQDAEAGAESAKVAVREVVKYPMTARLETVDRASRLMGLALAYDLAYDAWDQDTRDRARRFLRSESDELLGKVGGMDRIKPGDETQAMVVCSAGVADLAMLHDHDDPGAAKRLDAIAGYVERYLNEAVGVEGFGVAGEAARQAAFASGILPLVRADKLVRGRDLTTHPAVTQVMRPAILGTAPSAGMPVVGGTSSALDRSGLFAMATDLAPEADRPAIAWLFGQLGGERYLGVVRPHHGLYMLVSGLGDVEPAIPQGERWPTAVSAPKAGVALARTAWDADADLVTLLDHGRLRILGLGARWATFAGPHAGTWSHLPGAAGLDNRFGFSPEPGRKMPKVYQPSMSVTMDSMSADPAAGTTTARYTIEGTVKRLKAQITITEKDGNKKVEKVIDIPEGGDFAGQRVVGIDYSGRSGAAAVIVVADTLDGGGQAPRHWSLNLGYKTPDDKFAVNGNTFAVTIGGVTFRGTVFGGDDLELAATSNPPYANLFTATTRQPSVLVVMTLSRGDAPAVKAQGDGIQRTVTVGGASYQLADGKIVFK